jgi:lantibiotic modifying enzyme
MIPPAGEIESIMKLAEPRSSKRSADRLRRMFAALGDCDDVPPGHDPLAQLCAIGVTHGWRELERNTSSELRERISAPAQANLRRYLQSTLERITQPSFELESTSYTLALEALGLISPGAPPTQNKFLGNASIERLFSIFKKFPALAGLWSLTIGQWRDHIAEILTRSVADERAIRGAFFAGKAAGRIIDLDLGLSDRHRDGRSVALVEFEQGRVMYKPRSGSCEEAWDSLLRAMNENGFRPLLKSARVVRRKDYHWMEYIAPAGCDDTVAVRRFYKRLGGVIAGAYLLNAVDCHRENLIAAGEFPVLVDLDTLWHVSAATKSQSATDLLYRTGFFPNSNPQSLQSRSSALGKAATGTQSAAEHAKQIVAGFGAGWRSLVGTPRRRSAFLKRLRRIRSQERRWIYMATERYATIIRASLQPGALTSARKRLSLIRRLCRRPSIGSGTVETEIAALARLDIPYFTGKTNEAMPAPTASPPAELSKAFRTALDWTR